jgi:hypothetical protein
MRSLLRFNPSSRQNHRYHFALFNAKYRQALAPQLSISATVTVEIRNYFTFLQNEGLAMGLNSPFSLRRAICLKSEYYIGNCGGVLELKFFILK